MWMVRAGRGGYLIEEFKRKNIVAIGWDELGDLSKFRNSEEIKEAVKEIYPGYKPGQINISSREPPRPRRSVDRDRREAEWRQPGVHRQGRRVPLHGQIRRCDPRAACHDRGCRWIEDVLGGWL